MKRHSKESAIRVAIIYFIFSSIWIFGSDYLLFLISHDILDYRYISTIKGMVFILLSAGIIYYLVHQEIKEIKLAQLSINHLEQFDPLTNLYNRTAYNKKIEQLETSEDPLFVLLLDINGLKLINEVYSSESGDELLRQLANAVQEVMPDGAFIARIGGDEFCVLLEGEDQETFAESIQSLQHIKYEKAKGFETTVAIGSSSSIADNETITGLLTLAEDRMLKNKLLLNESSQNSVIASLLSTLYERSDETQEHSKRIQELCLKIGNEMNLLPTDLDELQLFALLHDIGKIGISDTILLKPGKLTDREYNLMKQHPMIGYKIASSVLPLEGIAHYILAHHEHWDGSGYPKGLKQTQIPLLSRILSVVDAFDAMTNDRVYRKKLTKKEAFEELIHCKGTQFDPTVVESFLHIHTNKKSSNA